MIIYLLRRKNESVGRDETISMVVAARDEDGARRLAVSRRHDMTASGQGYGDEGSKLWLDHTQSFCIPMGIVQGPARPCYICTSFYFA